jgi:NADH-quinone oxidoreductase subunit J
MIIQVIAFYAFAAIAIASGVMVVSSRNPVHSVLFLILAFFSAAGLFVLMGAEFLAMILVVVYVGAVAVLFLFVVMMLDINLERVREGFWRNLPVALVVGGIMVWEMITILAFRYFGVEPKQIPPDYSNTRELGRVLYTDYALAFEVAAVILLVAIVSAIALTLRRRKDSRYQDPARQVRARREERVRLVSMPSEKEQ